MRGRLNDEERMALMLDSIDTIQQYTQEIISFEDFEANKMMCHAVVYNLQCIGESVNRLSDEFTNSYPQIDWPAIAGLRHILVHDYYQVSMYRIWMILQNDLPVLNSFLRSLK